MLWTFIKTSSEHFNIFEGTDKFLLEALHSMMLYAAERSRGKNQIQYHFADFCQLIFFPTTIQYWSNPLRHQGREIL
jgi:hypothetical protein